MYKFAALSVLLAFINGVSCASALAGGNYRRKENGLSSFSYPVAALYSV